MMKKPSYFGGDASNLGRCWRMPFSNFAEFVDGCLNLAPPLNLTRAEYFKLEEAKQREAKKAPFFTPCDFAETPTQRTKANAQNIWLVCLDIDAAPEKNFAPARPYLAHPETLAQQLSPLNFAAYTTATSTPQFPRVRLVVEADGFTANSYEGAVMEVARRIGLAHVTPESLRPAQAMFRPSIFKGEAANHPLFHYRTNGRALTLSDIGATGGEVGILPQNTKGKPLNLSAEGNNEDENLARALSFLRPPLEGVTVQDARSALEKCDPDCSYPEWLAVAAALRHQFTDPIEAEAAYELFDEWSSRGKKYEGREETAAKWKSLHANPDRRVPVTIRTLFSTAEKNGWDSNPVKKKCYDLTRAAISHSQEKNVSHFLSESLRRIAGTPLLSLTEEEALLQLVIQGARERGAKVGLATVRKDLRLLKNSVSAADREKEKTAPPMWCRNLCYVAATDTFVKQATGESYKPEAFDRFFGEQLLPSEKDLREMGTAAPDVRGRPIMRPQDYALNIVQVPRVSDVTYSPQHFNDTIINDGGKKLLNVYTRNYPEADALGEESARKLIHRHLEIVIAEPENRKIFLDYLAFCVQNAGVKIRWAVLLQGAEGCGKTTFAAMLETAIGAGHVRVVAPEEMQGQWNDWAANCQVVAMEEIRVAGQNRHEIMNKLKPLISNDNISINERWRNARNIRNVTNYLLFTNYHNALLLTSNDRRYFVLKSKIQTKKQVRALGEEYFNKLFAEMKSNAGGIRAFFENHKISPEFNPNGAAPLTRYREHLAGDSLNDLQIAVREVLEDSTHPLISKDIVSSNALTDELSAKGINKISPQYLASVLRDEGWDRCGREWLGHDWGKHHLWTLAGGNFDAMTAPHEVRMRLAAHKAGI